MLSPLLPDPLLRTLENRFNPARFLAFPTTDEDLAGAAAALANMSGGHILLGAGLEPATGRPLTVPGIVIAEAEAAIAAALTAIDPPIEHLVTVIPVSAPADGTTLLLISVHQSPSPPHLVVPAGIVVVATAAGPRNVSSRAELDALYRRGLAERERADRQIDAMIEKLLQAHYAFYGVGFVACTQRPSSEPYLWARENIVALLAPDDPFCAGWKLTEDLAKVRPGEVEVRGDKEAHGYIRVTRSGCVAVGEVRRRPAGNAVGSVDDIVRRIHTMIQLAGRILAQAPASTVVPRLFYEGMRGQRVVVSQQPYAESTGLELDTAQFPGNLGDPADDGYVRRLTGEILTRLLLGFKVDYDGDADPLPSEE